MAARLAIYDESTAGEKSVALMLDVPTGRVTVKELIEMRIKREVERHNSNQRPIFNGLVQPTETEEELNGYRFKQLKRVDWQKQFDAAIKAFKANRIIALIDDRQVEDLDREFEIDHTTEVNFLKLVPLVGG
jgi:hypothetical protein